MRSFENKGPINLILNSTRLSIFGEGKWAAAKQEEKGILGRKKLHLATDSDGMLLAHKLTEHSVNDGNTGISLSKETKEKVRSVTAEATWGPGPIYDSATKRNARIIVPPARRASNKRRECPPRDKTIRRVKDVG